jgi:hypothetical protein
MFKYIGLIGILVYVLGWIAYLELSPTLGNIWWRTNSEGMKEFCPWGIWATAIAPFKRDHEAFWHPSFWDMNPWPVLGMLVIVSMFNCNPDTFC